MQRKNSKGTPEQKEPNEKPLTLTQIECLTDSILDNANHEKIVTIPLLLLMDNLAHNALDSSHVESLANTIKGRCYAATVDSDRHEDAYIKRVREQWWAKVEG